MGYQLYDRRNGLLLLDFDNYKSTLEDGLECIIIDTMAVNKFE